MERELRNLEEENRDRAAQELLSRRGAASLSPQATSTPSHSQVPPGPAWAGTKEGTQFFEEHFPSLSSPSHPSGFADNFVGEASAILSKEKCILLIPPHFSGTSNSLDGSAGHGLGKCIVIRSCHSGNKNFLISPLQVVITATCSTSAWTSRRMR